MSIQDLQQDPQDTSNFYLANIYLATINPNGSGVSTSPPVSPPPFSPPIHAVWVNALWFMSLVISLTCALLATLLQQWARRYLKITQSRYSPHKRARIRAFFAEGVTKCLLPWAVDTLPTLLHISLFLFFAGLVVFLCNVNLTIFKLVLSWVGLCTTLYGCITCMPILRHDSPYYTPLSLPTWHIVTGIPFLFYRFLRWFNDSVRHRYAYHRCLHLENSCRKTLVQGMQKTAEETALNSSSEIDTRAFMWTLDCLDEDHELESFFSALPDFRSSKVVKDPLPSLTKEEMRKLYGALRGLLERTFSSDLLPTPIKNWRALICAKAVDPEHTPIDPEHTPIDPEHLMFLGFHYTLPVREPKPTAFHILDMILSQYQHSGPVATGVAKVLRGWGNNMHEDTIVYAQLTICSVFATRQPRDDSWYIFASNELGFSETSLRDFAAQGDSLSFVILIHLIRLQFAYFPKTSWSQKHNFSFFLADASKLDATDTSSELQHQFCVLWNQIVREAQDGYNHNLAYYILRQIRSVYLSLHQGTDSSPTQFSASTGLGCVILRDPFLYPVCKVPDHLFGSTPHTHDDGVSATLTRAIPDDPNIPASVPSLTSPDPSFSSAHVSLPVLTDALPLDNQISVPVSTQIKGHSIPTIPLSPVIEPSGTMQPSMPGLSPKSNTSTSSPADIAVGLSTLHHTPLDVINVRSSSTPPVLDNILLTDL